MAGVVGELTVGPPLGVDPVGQIGLRIQNKQTYSNKAFGNLRIT